MTREEQALEVFPVKLRECGDGRDENFINRQCWLLGYNAGLTRAAEMAHTIGHGDVEGSRENAYAERIAQLLVAERDRCEGNNNGR